MSLANELIELLYEGWHKHDDGSYSADISSIDAHRKKTGQLPRHPVTRKPIDVHKVLKAKKDSEGDVTHWEGHHDGAHLIVWND